MAASNWVPKVLKQRAESCLYPVPFQSTCLVVGVVGCLALIDHSCNLPEVTKKNLLKTYYRKQRDKTGYEKIEIHLPSTYFDWLLFEIRAHTNDLLFCVADMKFQDLSQQL